MPDLLPSTRLAIRPDILSSSVGEEGIVLLDPAASAYLGTDGVGALIWRRLGEGPQTLAALCDAVEAAYDVDAATCRADVSAFLDDLLRRHVIVLA